MVGSRLPASVIDAGLANQIGRECDGRKSGASRIILFFIFYFYFYFLFFI